METQPLSEFTVFKIFKSCRTGPEVCVLLARTGGASIFLGGAISPTCDKIRCQSDSLLLLSSPFRCHSPFSLTAKCWTLK